MVLTDVMWNALLVGRDDERRVLAEGLAAAAAGHGNLMLVSGEAGIGKTALVEALERDARSQGTVVLIARCYDHSSDAPYSLWADLGHGLPWDDQQLTLPLAITQSDAEVSVRSQHTLLRELVRFFEGVAHRGPFVLVLEDLHWADVESLSALRILARRLRELPVLVVATYRTDELTRRHTLHQLVPQLVREARAGRLTLRPLTDDDIRAFVRASFPLTEGDEARLVHYLAARADGNPLFVTELLRTLVEDGGISSADGTWAVGELEQNVVPLLVQQVIDERLARLSASTRRALEVASVIGQEMTWDLWQEVVELDIAAMSSALREAVDAHMLRQQPDGDRLAFSHALVRETLYGRLTIPERRMLHRRVAEALTAGDAAAPDVVAHHFRVAHDDRLTEWLIQAGRRATRTYSLRSAAQRYEEALKHLAKDPSPSAVRAQVQFDLAHTLRFAEPARAIRYLDDAARDAQDIGNDVLRAYATIDGGMLRCFAGDIRRGFSAIQSGFRLLEALAGQAQVLDRDQAVQFSYHMPIDSLGRSSHYRLNHREGTLVAQMAFSGRLREARDLGERIIYDYEQSALSVEYVVPPSGVYIGTGMAHAGVGAQEQARRRMGQGCAYLVRAENHAMVGMYQIRELVDIQLVYAPDDLPARQALADAAEASWRRSGDALPVGASPRGGSISLLLLEGQWSEARRLAHTEVAHGFVLNRPVASRVLAAIAVRTGDVQTALRRIHALLPDGAATEPGDVEIFTGLDLQRLAIELALDQADYPGALAWLEAHERWIDWSGADGLRPLARLLRATYLRATGDLAGAEAVAREALALAAEPRQPLTQLGVARLLGELALDERAYERAERHLATAFDLAVACEAPYERALLLLPLARLTAARGQHDRARELLEESRTVLLALDARPALLRLEVVAATIRARPSSAERATEPLPAGLSPREAEVLRLIGSGRSNADISQTLGLSVRTVERHISNLYAKIDAHSRTDAVAFAIRRNFI